MLDYPRPPYPSQQQPMPGSTSAMKPRPDHGEESYKGSGRLAGKKAVITGGDSGRVGKSGSPYAVATMRGRHDGCFMAGEHASSAARVRTDRGVGTGWWTPGCLAFIGGSVWI
jgi:hypothetical protein